MFKCLFVRDRELSLGCLKVEWNLLRWKILFKTHKCFWAFILKNTTFCCVVCGNMDFNHLSIMFSNSLSFFLQRKSFQWILYFAVSLMSFIRNVCILYLLFCLHLLILKWHLLFLMKVLHGFYQLLWLGDLTQCFSMLKSIFLLCLRGIVFL